MMKDLKVSLEKIDSKVLEEKHLNANIFSKPQISPKGKCKTNKAKLSPKTNLNNGKELKHQKCEDNDESQIDKGVKEKENNVSSCYEEEKAYSCFQCNKSFKYLSGLEAHENTHTHELSFKCDQCRKSFTQKSHLKRHQLSHKKGKNKFKCSKCSKSFTQNYYLEVHERVHSGIKPYECKECCKRFSQKSHLNTHMKIHKEDQKFKCDNCGKSFTLSHHLTSHLQRIHPLRGHTVGVN